MLPSTPCFLDYPPRGFVGWGHDHAYQLAARTAWAETALFTRRSRLPRAPPLSRPRAWRCSKVERRAEVCRWRARWGVSTAPPRRLFSVYTARAFAQAYPLTGLRRLIKSRSQARLTPPGVPDNGHWSRLTAVDICNMMICYMVHGTVHHCHEHAELHHSCLTVITGLHRKLLKRGPGEGVLKVARPVALRPPRADWLDWPRAAGGADKVPGLLGVSAGLAPRAVCRAGPLLGSYARGRVSLTKQVQLQGLGFKTICT